MFSKLIASGPQRRRNATPGAVTLSVVVHAAVLAGAVYASVQAPAARAAVEEEVTFVEIEEPQAEPPPPPEPEAPPPPPPSAEAPPPPPQGFQELIPPLEPPPIIPVTDLSQPAVRLEDFSGIGVAGGVADGVEGGTPQNAAQADSSFAYEVGVLEERPRLQNERQVQSVVSRLYPRNLLDAGIGGSVTLQFVIEADGRVNGSTVKVVSSTHDRFVNAAVEAIEHFRFQPGRFRGQKVRVLIQMPITWQARRS